MKYSIDSWIYKYRIPSLLVARITSFDSKTGDLYFSQIEI